MKRELLLPRTRAKLPPHPEQTSSQLLSARGMWLSSQLCTVRAMSTRLPRSISCRWAMPRGALEDGPSLTKPWCREERRWGLPAAPLGAALAQSEAAFPCRAEERVNTRVLPTTSAQGCSPPGRGMETLECPRPRPWRREAPLLRAPRRILAAMDVTEPGKRAAVAGPPWSASTLWGD